MEMSLTTKDTEKTQRSQRFFSAALCDFFASSVVKKEISVFIWVLCG